MKPVDNNRRGQLVVMLFLILPVLIIILIILARVSVVLVTKARLQVTADRAAWAAGEMLTGLMNQLAQLNWRIHHEFRQQEREFTSQQQQSAARGRQKIRDRQLVIDQLRGKMAYILETGYTRACQAALDVVMDPMDPKATPWAEMLPLYGGARVVAGGDEPTCETDRPLFSFYDDAVREDQWPALAFTHPIGGAGYDDPKDTDTHDDTLLSYRTKMDGPDQQVAFALRLRAPSLLEDQWLAASAAVQPVGGSIEASAFFDADNGEDLESRLDDAGLLYETTLVPLDRLQQRELGYQGLRYFDPAEGWMEDEAFYLQ